MEPSSYGTATQYRLQGDGVEVVFRCAADEPVSLEYNGQSYLGEAVSCESTHIGRVVSVFRDGRPDLDSTSFAVVIPDTNTLPRQRSASVETFAIVLTERSSIEGPSGVDGQIQSYKIIPLSGVAW